MPIISSRMVPEPKHDTYSASFRGKAEHRTDAVRRVVHRRQPRPVARPAVHVLLVARLQELQLAQGTVLVELLHVEELAAEYDRLHHHVAEAGGVAELDDAFAVLDTGRHGHGAGDVFARFERGDRHRRVVGNRRVDMDEVDVGIFQQLGVVGVAAADPECVADPVEAAAVALADREHVGVRVPLINRDELGAEPEADDGCTKRRHEYRKGWLVARWSAISVASLAARKALTLAVGLLA